MVKPIALALLGAFASTQALAAGNTLFDELDPLTAPAVAVSVADEATHGLLVSSAPGINVTVTSLASRSTVGDLGDINVGRYWDMIDTNRTGTDPGRYLFMPFEPSNQAGDNTASGALRYDLWTGKAETIVPVGTQNWQRGDASQWAPWGGWITGEENFSPNSATTVASGRLFEVTNPTTATATNLTDGNGNLVQRNNVIPRVSHEGLAFDSANNFYFIDENSSGSFYKFVSDQPNATSGDAFFEAGTVYAMKVGAGSNASASGAFTWAALDPLDADGRRAADNVGATAYNRPEDMEIFTLGNGNEAIAFTATGTHDVWTVDLATNQVFQLVTRNTIDVATGLAVGSALASPDNMAKDADGNLYIIEDQGVPNADIWQVIDADKDGVAEGVKRWAALQVAGAEPTGLFFDPFDPTKAYLNIQHPNSDNDRLLMISVSAVPEPETYAMLLAGLGLVGAVARRRRA
jgi:secreted PhoX family phosphatase